jgi:hypothetical protein
MKTSALTSRRSLTVNNEIGVLPGWGHLLEELKEFFIGTFESDWEEKTGLDWGEFGKFPYIQ